MASFNRPALIFVGLSIIFIVLSSSFLESFIDEPSAGCKIIYGFLGVISTALCLVTLHISCLHPQALRSSYYNIQLYCHIMYAHILGLVHFDQFARYCTKLQQSQEELLMSVIKGSHKDQICQYGQKYNFNEIHKASQYTTHVPVTTYNDYRPVFVKMLQGETGILTEKSVVHMTVTPTNDGKGKLWPVVNDFSALQTNITTTILWLHFLFTRVRVTLRPILRLSYRAELPRNNTEIPTVQQLRYPNPVTSNYFVSPKEVYLLADERTAYYIHALCALSRSDLQGMELGNPQQSALFWQLIQTHWQEMCWQIECGQVPNHLDITPKLREILNAHLPASPHRARELRQAFRHGWVGVAKHIWPHLKFVDLCEASEDGHTSLDLLSCQLRGAPFISVIHMHGSIVLGVHVPQPRPGFPMSYVFLPHHTFYEFIPEQQWDQDQPATLLLHQVKVGQQYQLAVTTRSGLYRLKLPEKVLITSAFNKCPVYQRVL